MSHENPASIVPGSMHVNRKGKKVFIESVHVAAPWRTSTIHRPIVGFVEGEDITRTYLQNGQWFYEYDNKESSTDLIREYKEPVVHEAYVVVWSDGIRDARCSLELAKHAARAGSNQGRLTWKIFKLTGSEEYLDNEASK